MRYVQEERKSRHEKHALRSTGAQEDLHLLPLEWTERPLIYNSPFQAGHSAREIWDSILSSFIVDFFFFFVHQLELWCSLLRKDICECDCWAAFEIFTFCLQILCMLGISVAGIHPSRTWRSGSLRFVRWNACVQGLDLGLYSVQQELEITAFAGIKLLAGQRGSSLIPLANEVSVVCGWTEETSLSELPSMCQKVWSATFSQLPGH